MAITIVNAQATSVTAAASTGITVTKPTGLADGDVLYAFISKTTFANTSNFTCSGWTGLTPATAGSTTQNDRHTTILRKVITTASGEPSNYTFVVSGNATSSQMVGIIIALRGVNNATPEDITVPAYGVIANNSTPATLNATSATANAFVIAHLQISLATAATKTPGAPSGYTLVTGGNASETAGGSLDNQCMTAYKTLGAAGSTTGTNAWTNGTNDAASESLTAVVLVRPEPTVVQATASAAWGGLTGTAAAAEPTIIYPEDYGAGGAGATNDATALQSALDAMTSNTILDIRVGKIYNHNVVLNWTTPGKIIGPGRIHATVQTASAFKMSGTFQELTDVEFSSVNTSRGTDLEHHKVVISGSQQRLTNTLVSSSHSVGFFVYGASRPILDNVVLTGSRADAIHVTNGSTDVVINTPNVANCADDGVAVVSYDGDASPCSNVVVQSPVVANTAGRGCAIVGGNNIRFYDIDVDHTVAAGLYIACESNTRDVDDVIVTVKRINRANDSTDVDHGDVLFYAEGATKSITNTSVTNSATVTNGAITNSIGHPSTAWHIRGLEIDSGIVDVTISNMRVAPNDGKTLVSEDLGAVVNDTNVAYATQVEATASAAWGGLGATATATPSTPTSYFWEPFDQANGAPVGWISLGAIDWGVISGRGTTNNNTGLHGMGVLAHGVDLSGDWEVIVDANASLTIGNGSVNVGLVDGNGVGYSIAIANETHLQVRTTGYVNGGNFSGANRTNRATLVRWTYTASGNWFRVYHDSELVEEVQNTTNTAMMGGAVNLVVYLQETTSPTNECSFDNLFVGEGTSNQYPPGTATTQATASAAFGGLTGTVTATPLTPVQATAFAAWGGLTATASADVTPGTPPVTVAPLPSFPTIIQPTWVLPKTVARIIGNYRQRRVDPLITFQQPSTAVGKSLDTRWGVRTTLNDSLDTRWSVRTALGDQIDYRWNVRTALGDQIDYRWGVRTRVNDSLDTRWSVRTILGDQTDLRWNTWIGSGQVLRWSIVTWQTKCLPIAPNLPINTKQDRMWATGMLPWWSGIASFAIGKSSDFRWSLRVALGDQIDYRWHTKQASFALNDIRWGVRTKFNDSLDTRWGVRTKFNDSVDYRWSVRTFVGDQSDFRWRLKALIGDTSDVRWNIKALVNDASDLRWSIRSRINDSSDLRWAIRTVVGDQEDIRWGIRTGVGDQADFRWGIRVPLGDNTEFRWSVRALLGDPLDIRWDVLGPVGVIGDALDIRWRVRTRLLDETDLRWALRSTAGDSSELRWGIRTLTGDNNNLRWNVRALINDQNDLRWGIRTSFNDSIDYRWVVRALIGDQEDLRWAIKALTGDQLGLVWNVLQTGTVGDLLDLRWNVRSTFNDTLDLRWKVWGYVGKSINPRWSVRALLADNANLRWGVRTTFNDNLELLWGLGGPVGDTLGLVWNTRAKVNQQRDLRWRTIQSVSKQRDLRWVLRALTGDQQMFVWNTRSKVTDSVGIQWGIRTFFFDQIDYRWAIRTPAGDSVALQWNLKAHFGDNLDLRWRLFGQEVLPLVIVLYDYESMRISLRDYKMLDIEPAESTGLIIVTRTR